MLELSDVSRAHGRDPILTRISLDLPSGVPTAVLGLSPPARETFLRLLSGADRPQTGSIRLGGAEISRVRKEKGRIVRVGASGLKPSGQKIGKLIGAETAARVGLAGRLEARIDELDPEHRMRLAIGAAREARPSLLLLDAPAAQLTGDARAGFIAGLSAMLAETGAVVVLAAGLPDEAQGLGGRIVVLDRGQLLQQGGAAEVFAQPASLAAALATSHPALNTLAMTAREGQGVLSDGSTFQPPENLSFPPAGGCTLAFRPDDASLERQGQGCVRFVVRAAGEETVSGRRFARIRFVNADWLAPLPSEAPPPGMVMNAFVDRTRLMVFDDAGKMVA
jgi:ABC-type sulfate/molybdate transport systems ATPase subunit